MDLGLAGLTVGRFCQRPEMREFVVRYRSMGNLLVWLGLGAAQKGARSKEVKPSRHRVISFVVGILLALLIVAGLFIVSVTQQ